MTQELRVIIGIPASGKSTFIKQEEERIKTEYRTVCIVSRDYIRQSLLQPEESYFAHEDEVFDEFIKQINEAMEIGFDVVFADATHITRASRKKLLSRLQPDPNTELILEVIGCTLELALERNSKREGFAKVPDSAIINMAKRSQYPNYTEISEYNYGFKSTKIRFHNVSI